MSTSPKKPSHKEYDHKKIETKWQKTWKKNHTYRTTEDADKDKYYVLDMFPYPSGEGLHVGHPKGYIATDVVSRQKRMQGKNILHPMGFDAFGLPAENYAIKNKTNPAVAVAKNVARYKKQLEILGFNYDWDREINTTDPKYYTWTQWIFLQLLKKGLAYESYEPINWCPVDKTGLANEDVENGRCERCGAIVEQKLMRQWVLRITEYAERMLADIDTLDWPESIKESQRNWIGKSEGAEIDFRLVLTKQKPRFVLLHGYKGSAEKNFFPWLKSELEKRGHEVEVPDLPHADAPTEAEQVEYVIKHCHFDENTVLVGHSLGGVVAMKVLMKLRQKISGLVLVAPAIDPAFPGCKERPFHKTFSWDFDFQMITNLTGSKIAVLSDTREEKRAPYLENLAKKLSARRIVTQSAEEHFTAMEEPEVLKSVTPVVTVFTTRADTIFSGTFIILAPEHPWIQELKSNIENLKEVEAYIAETKAKQEIERTSAGRDWSGVALQGITAINPATNEPIAVWIADFVLPQYGTGAVFADAHDERDFFLAKKYNIPLKVSIQPADVAVFENVKALTECYSGEGILFNSGEFDGLSSAEARKNIVAWLEKRGTGRQKTTYKLRNWVFSRQRYWGEPIPIIHCDECGIVPVPEKDLPVVLPKVKSYEPTGTGESPLAAISKWVNVKCPTCGGKAKRETNTMPQWAGSSWYYLRYMDPNNNKALVAPEKEKYWAPVDFYVGGAEHATRHLIYARFWHKFLYDLGVVSTAEPFKKLQSVGLIMAEDGRKMSKRFGNVVNPDDIVARFGADTLRVYEMFMGPFDQAISWSTDSMVGSRRFLEKVWKLAEKCSAKKTENSIDTILHQSIKKVTEDIESIRFNTAVSQLMILVNHMEKCEVISLEQYSIVLRLLAPFAPHITEELWQHIGESGSIHHAAWPAFDASKIVSEIARIVIQINGKVRKTIEAQFNVTQGEIESLVYSDASLSKWFVGGEVIKVIFVPNRLINFVVTGVSKR